MAKRPETRKWYAAFETVEPFVVKIMTPNGTGTGFFLHPQKIKS
jgi:hypothetical protein